MRGVSLAILLVLAVATVLAFSLRSLEKERDRLSQGFVNARDAEVRDLVSDLEDRLRDLRENARVVETLVARMRAASPAERDDRTRTLRASFDAMATVIRHFRTLVWLKAGTCDPLVEAVDPTEIPATARALIGMSCGPNPAPPRIQQVIGPITLPGRRAFYLYSFPAGPDTVVISIEGSLLLQAAFRSLPDSRLVVTDPHGAEWVTSGESLAFEVRSPERRAEEENLWTGPNGSAWISGSGARSLGLPPGQALAAWASVKPGGLGTWRVLVIRSARNFQSRQRALVRQVILTAAGLLAAIGLVGTLIVRQQRYSGALAERLRSAEALRSLERQLISTEKLATTGVLAAGIAHEVGTPLGIIRARAELLLGDIERADSRRALEAIIDQIDRISSTIRQVLDFSRAQPVELARVDVMAAVKATLDLLGHRLRQQHIQVSLEIAPDLPPLAADPNQLQQVLINLLLNACDACTNDGSIEIGAREVEGGTRIRMELRDRGTGIQAEHLLAVFDPFFTTKKRGEGTGLGLPIASSIVRNHGGEISLASVPGQGTTVTVSWPVAAEDSHAL